MSILLSLVLLVGAFSPTAFAVESFETESNETMQTESWIIEIEMSESTRKWYQQIQSMSTEELNALIDAIASGSEVLPLAYPDYPVNDPIASAWFAAGQIAINKGYTCSGLLVQYSVCNTNYSETNSTFAAKIKKSSEYDKFLDALPTAHMDAEFNKDGTIDGNDLYYSLHGCDFDLRSSSYGARCHVTDTFDFKVESYKGDLFSTFVNNWAWLSTQLSYLHVITVSIQISI